MTAEESPAEREARGREEVLKAFDLVCPNVLGNPFIPHWPFPQQALFLGLHQQEKYKGKVFECLYGGAAGGGKSDALLMAAAQYAWKHRDFAGLIIRRTFQELSKPGAIMDRAKEWWIPKGVKFRADEKRFDFPGGGTVVFGYLDAPTDHLQYQGSEYNFIAFDELTQFKSDDQYRYVAHSRIRRSANSRIPSRILCTSNPGGPGHAWVKNRFIGGIDPVTGRHVDPVAPFVPAKVTDNKHIDQEQYIESLNMLHPTVRAQLLEGDWNARDPGDYFRAEWFGPLLSYETDVWPSSDCVRIRWWDLAASEAADAAFTAGVRMARHRSGVRAIEHCRSFRATPGKRDDLIVQTAKADGPTVIVGLEIEGGSGGLAQFYALEKRLKENGIRVVGARPQADLSGSEPLHLVRNSANPNAKMARADPVASCLERGYQRRGEGPDTGSPWYAADAHLPVTHQRDGIRLFAGPWTQGYLDVIEGFPNAATCDEVDATSGAWSWLEAHAFGGRIAPVPREVVHAASKADLHPEDRDKLEQQARRGRRWEP